MNSPIVNKSYHFVRWLYREYLPFGFRDFQLDICMDLKNKLVSEGLKQDLTDHELEILSLAAILHNSGCIEGAYQGKNVSKAIARSFLTEQGQPLDLTEAVLRCIDATEHSHLPLTHLEALIQEVSIGGSYKTNLSDRVFEVGDLLP